MKKFIAAFAVTKLILLTAFAVLFFSRTDSAINSGQENALAQATPPAVRQAEETVDRPTSEPYTGSLSIFEGEERAKNLQIDRVMDILQIKEGKTVADVGAGSGWFTVRAAKRVGADGKVFAVEINQDFINHIDERARREKFANIQTVLGAEDNPNLPESSVDAALILKTYHEIAQPVKVLQNLRTALKKDALLGIIDRNGKGDDHGLDRDKVIEEAGRAGFVLAEQYDFVKPDGMDYFLVFKIK